MQIVHVHSRLPFANLVKLIDKTHTLVSENQSPGLESPLLGDGAALDVRSETHGRRTLTRREDGPRGYLLHVLEELGLGSTWVTTEQHVDVTTQLVLLTYRMSVSPSLLTAQTQTNCSLYTIHVHLNMYAHVQV